MNRDKSNFKPIFVSQEEEDIICDIRGLEFGKILINMQNGAMVSKEITKTIRNIHKKNTNSNENRNHNSNIGSDDINLNNYN
ncbi:MAG: hypothetical protein KAI67_01805 [Candidatus Pacebacteria bacterium]|nr:hypothetical protein [Candidatus Paceibacterota bacterium]